MALGSVRSPAPGIPLAAAVLERGHPLFTALQTQLLALPLGGAVDAAQCGGDAGKTVDPLESSERRQVKGKLAHRLNPFPHMPKAVADGQGFFRSLKVELGETLLKPRVIEI